MNVKLRSELQSDEALANETTSKSLATLLN